MMSVARARRILPAAATLGAALLVAPRTLAQAGKPRSAHIFYLDVMYAADKPRSVDSYSGTHNLVEKLRERLLQASVEVSDGSKPCGRAPNCDLVIVHISRMSEDPRSGIGMSLEIKASLKKVHPDRTFPKTVWRCKWDADESVNWTKCPNGQLDLLELALKRHLAADHKPKEEATDR